MKIHRPKSLDNEHAIREIRHLPNFTPAIQGNVNQRTVQSTARAEQSSRLPVTG